MLAVWKFLGSISILFCLTICSANNISNRTIPNEEYPLKMHLVEDIVRKICNISLNTFSNKNPAEKAILLTRVEEKLNKSASALGIHGEKYVALIMKGLKAKAFDNNQATNYKQAAENKKAVNNKQVAEDEDIEVINTLREGPEKAAKSDLVHNIANKIELLARDYLKNAETEEERQKIIPNIKNTFVKSADRKHAILHDKHDEIKNYVDLVAKDIELVMKRDSVKRRMEFAYDNINLNKDSQGRDSVFVDPIKPDSIRNNELDRGPSKPNSVFLISCDSTIKETCHKIKMLKTLRCLSDNREFNILKLCDGVGDCLDFSDENQCGQQAMETIKTANRLISIIDTSMNAHHCFLDLMDKSKLAKQNMLLSDVLKKQLTFLEKHTLQNSETLSRRAYNTDKSVITETVHEAVNVVDSFISALGMSICPNFNKYEERELDVEDLEQKIYQASYNKSDQENCKCNRQNCLKTCSQRCDNICFEMYSLTQLRCDAVSGEDLVSLDMICDGKFDCYNEIDEKDCSEDINLAKFEATHMYDYILKEIELKTGSILFEAVRSRLQSLHALVTKLQKLTLKRQPDVQEVKRVRQACFAELSKVYDSALIHMKSDQNELFNIRFFLITLNERLVSALKRSNTGNDKFISSDDCVCRGNKCALPRCSKSCIRACSVEPQLTRFFCGELSEHSNNSIPIELVCNKKVNCPNGEDEKDCKKDVCHSHHLLFLRRKLQKVGDQYSGTTLGEALRSWRVKVTATLMLAENNERPSKVVLYDILHDMLHDLVMTYGILEDRRDNTPVFNEFYLWSRVVIDTLKSCSQ